MSERDSTPPPKPLQALPLEGIEGLEGLVCDPNDPDCAATATATTTTAGLERAIGDDARSARRQDEPTGS